MIKLFFIGILLGIAIAAGAMYALPAVDQYREASIISVAPNSGNREVFHINIPADRIMVGGSEQESSPAAMIWPDEEVLAGVGAELFKVRNSREAVIGVAARTVAIDAKASVLDWVIHLPARGSFYVNMDSAGEDGYRQGGIRTGSREFSKLSGMLTERWVADTSGEEDAPDGHIELAAIYVGTGEPIE